MGRYRRFQCDHCRYGEDVIPVGRGSRPGPVLRLFRCGHCRSVGSTWSQPGEAPYCSVCYDEDVELLADDTAEIACPKCEEVASFWPLEGEWE